jgi:asparagine synthase (glutamine-hydrolysing)
MAGTWERTPGPLRALAAAAARRGPARARRIVGLMDAPDPGARLLASTALMRRCDQDRLFGGALAEYADAAAGQIRARAGSVSALPALEAALSLEAQLGMADDRLHYFDRTSMAWSLEVRVPFLDHHVVEACAQMPSRLKVRGTKGKRVLHTAARGIVPDFVLSKRKLGFFSESVDGWLATQGGAAVDRLLLDGEPACAELLDGGAVRDVVRGWREGDAAMARPVLGLLMLELWMTEFVPRAEDLARGATPEGAVAA